MTEAAFPELVPGDGEAHLPADWLRSNLARCRSCGSGVLWAVHRITGRRAPFDAEPAAGSRQLIPHFATCPRARLSR